MKSVVIILLLRNSWGSRYNLTEFSGQAGSIRSSLGDEFNFGLVLIESDLDQDNLKMLISSVNLIKD